MSTPRDPAIVRFVATLEHAQSLAAQRARELDRSYQLARQMSKVCGRWVVITDVELETGRSYFVRRRWCDDFTDPVCLATWNDGWTVDEGILIATSEAEAVLEVWLPT